MKIRNVHYDDLRVPDLDNLVIKAGEIVEVEDAVGWGLCRGDRFEVIDEVSAATFGKLEAKEQRRIAGITTATWDPKRGKFVIRCYQCRQWLVRCDYDGRGLEIAASATAEVDDPDLFKSGDVAMCGKCSTRFRVSMPAL